MSDTVSKDEKEYKMRILSDEERAELKRKMGEFYHSGKLILTKKNNIITYNPQQYGFPVFTDEDIIESSDEKLIFKEKSVEGQNMMFKFEVYLKRDVIENFRKSEEEIYHVNFEDKPNIDFLSDDKLINFSVKTLFYMYSINTDIETLITETFTNFLTYLTKNPDSLNEFAKCMKEQTVQ